jgi:hypothetical protein
MSILQSLCNFNGLLYAAWKGEVGDDRLFYSSFNGTTWTPQTLIPGNSSAGPSLAVFGSAMYAAWKGEGSDERIFYSKFAGGAWQPQVLIAGIASSTGPSLAAMGNKLYAVWKGMGSDQAIWNSAFDGTNWTPQAVVPAVATSVGPSLAFYNNKLWMAWKGMYNDQGLYYASFNGTSWSPQALIPGTASSVGPSLTGYNGKLYAAWKGESGDQSLWYSSFDGTSWAPQTPIPGAQSSVGPALQEYQSHGRGVVVRPGSPGDLYAMWKGANADQQLRYAFFDTAKWSSQGTVPGNTGQDTPQNIGVRMQYQETTEWCWMAVATSISHFYNPASTATQCATMTIVGQNINGFAKNTSACPSAAAVAKVPGLAAILANPYTPAAENVLNNPVLGIPIEYIKSGGVGDALNVHGNWKQPGVATLTLAQMAAEISAGRPICANIAWNAANAGQHVVVIAGVLNDQLLICDPANGESVIQYEDFPAFYSSGASLVDYNLTQAGT